MLIIGTYTMQATLSPRNFKKHALVDEFLLYFGQYVYYIFMYIFEEYC